MNAANDNLLLTRPRSGVALVTLNRPGVLNALDSQLMTELTALLQVLDADDSTKAVVVTGSAKAFAAGADIKEMASQSFSDVYAADWFAGWSALAAVRTPLVAAVSGYALGGGCELAMMCDVLIAADTAKFGQPEITLGVIPGMGGSQRLTYAVGKAKAMDMCLTGRTMDAEEAERCGLVSRIVAADDLADEAVGVAERIASMSAPAARMVTEAVDRVFETPLSEGLLFERRLFHSTFATEDQSEGMEAFLAKRSPNFRDR